MAVTVTIKLVVVVKPAASFTDSVSALSPNVASQVAVTLAEIVPAVFAKSVRVIPVGIFVAAMVKLPAAVSLSLTVASVAIADVEPCARVIAAAGVIEGGVFAQELSSSDRLFEPELATAMSIRLSLLRSPTAKAIGLLPASKTFCGSNVPSPFPFSKERLRLPLLLIARSSLASPSKSATTIALGSAPVS